MSVFTTLPQDMLQWEIARFLTHKDTLNWNEVLKNDERVYKKLPTDYAIQHQIHLSYHTYQEIAKEIHYNIDRITAPWLGNYHIRQSVKMLKKYFAWFNDPKNHIVLMYTKGRKEGFLENIGEWTEIDVELYEYIPETDVEALRTKAFETLNLVADVKFVRHVNVKDFKNAFVA